MADPIPTLEEMVERGAEHLSASPHFVSVTRHEAGALLTAAGVPELLERLERAETALWRCVELSGEDTSDGRPTEPALDVLAVRAVEMLRESCDEARAALPSENSNDDERTGSDGSE